MFSRSEFILFVVVVVLAALLFTGLFVKLRYYRDGIGPDPGSRPAVRMPQAATFASGSVCAKPWRVYPIVSS